MVRRLPGTLPLLLGLLAAGCADQNDSSPVAPHGDDIAAAKTKTECNFSAFNSLTAQYFTNAARRQEASAYVNTMQANGAFSTAAVDAGFNLLDEIARTLDSTYNGFGTSGPAETGSALAQTTIRCMYDDLGTLPDFTVSLDPASKGAFQVRGGSSDASRTPVLARSDYGSEPLSGIAPAGTSTWGSIVKTADGSSFTRTLIYGKPLLSNPLVQTSAPDPLQYQWEAIRPDISFAASSAIVAICAATGEQDWVHESNFGVLAFAPGNNICTARPLPGLGMGRSGWRPSILAHRIVEVLSPKPLYATMVSLSIGGSAGGLKSVFSKKTIPAALLRFLPPIPSVVKVNSPITVTLEAKSSDLALMNGVTVSLAGTNNNGTPTKLVQWNGTTCGNTPPSGVTGVSRTGIVEITFCITKTGGLSLIADGAGRSTTFTSPHTKLNVKP